MSQHLPDCPDPTICPGWCVLMKDFDLSEGTGGAGMDEYGFDPLV